MDANIKDRIKFVRKKRNKTQEDFAKLLNLSGNFIHLIEKGDRQPSERTISDIARIYYVNEEWLRTGEGEWEKDISPDVEIAGSLGDALSDKDSFRSRLYFALSRMSDGELDAIEKLIDNLSGEKE
jgi:transcriptional regulator with XRE-family HTH domain